MEIESRQLNLLSAEQPLQVSIEIGKVERIERFEVIFALFVFGGIFPVEEVVIQRDADRTQQVGRELHLQTFTEGGLSGRGRSGNQHHAHALLITCGNLFRNLCDLFLLHRLRDQDQLLRMPTSHRTIEVAHIVQANGALQGEVLFVSAKHLILRNDRFQLSRIISARHTQQQAILVRDYVEQLNAPSGGSQTTIEEVDVAIQLIIGGIDHAG